MRTDAGLQSWAINTDKDVKDGSAEQATFDIWHENVMETNHVYLQTVAWCRAWGTYPRSQWEVAAGNASWEIAVPLVKRLKRAAARYTSIRRYADRLVNYAYAYEWMNEWMNARPRECAILSQPDARAGRTRGLFYCLAMSDPLVTNWRTGHDTTGRDTTGHNITR